MPSAIPATAQGGFYFPFRYPFFLSLFLLLSLSHIYIYILLPWSSVGVHIRSMCNVYPEV